MKKVLKLTRSFFPEPPGTDAELLRVAAWIEATDARLKRLTARLASHLDEVRCSGRGVVVPFIRGQADALEQWLAEASLDAVGKRPLAAFSPAMDALVESCRQLCEAQPSSDLGPVIDHFMATASWWGREAFNLNELIDWTIEGRRRSAPKAHGGRKRETKRNDEWLRQFEEGGYGSVPDFMLARGIKADPSTVRKALKDARKRRGRPRPK